MQFTLSENNLQPIIQEVLERLKSANTLLLIGNLGSGKTTFTKQLLLQMGVKETITSPTFNIVSEYILPNGKSVFHFDLYRIKTIDELYQIGFEEMVFSDNISIIEWPEIAESLLPENAISLQIELFEDMRTYTLS